MSAGGRTITVSVKPRAHRDEVRTAADGRLEVRVTAPPANGAANARMLRVLARHLGVAPTHLRIAAGHRGRHKRVVVIAPKT